MSERPTLFLRTHKLMESHCVKKTTPRHNHLLAAVIEIGKTIMRNQGNLCTSLTFSRLSWLQRIVGNCQWIRKSFTASMEVTQDLQTGGLLEKL